ncbi:hypothetical protein SPRG_07668 [Saprolegnia parasitica CBS 223.65]|uniref:Homeobox domain-containing protein n=1 Tax=Saprolegnia parasitica (strain CBS 223.65) TaxID=695850 RepID=A0A067CCP1_SAPPC|nr:hypothetical protein SPRG_07668 [Saprolegnia parasitica CBS 223.65]KDO26955.1 hypothetical protein SPRG_07668 [Saprolegnia parasitica CBS 223.65]|eukprot:XP_012202336.1 hypothetical protein SPRG_07668 [Saprolegnia parasitica CBS 223.65]
MTKALEKESTTVLRAWMFSDAHFLHPYPTPSEREALARAAQLTPSQVKNWFINARKRLWQPLLTKFNVAASPQSGATRVDPATWRSLQPLLRRLRMPAPVLTSVPQWSSPEEAAFVHAVAQAFVDGALQYPRGTPLLSVLYTELPTHNHCAISPYVRATGMEAATYVPNVTNAATIASTRAHLQALRAKMPGHSDNEVGWDVILAVMGKISMKELDALLEELAEGGDDDWRSRYSPSKY